MSFELLEQRSDCVVHARLQAQNGQLWLAEALLLDIADELL